MKKATADVRASAQGGWSINISPWLSRGIVCLIGVAAYSNTFQSTFHFDDSTSIANNLAIRDLANLRAIFQYSPTRFVTYLSFALNYHLGELNVVGYHILNLLIHLLTAILAGVVTNRVLETPLMKSTDTAKAGNLLSLLVALFFVAHPVQTQGITYIAQRAASLAALFYLLTLSLYARARLLQMANGPRSTVALYLCLASIAGLLGLFTKETMLTLPFALLMFEFFFLRKMRKKSWLLLGLVTAAFAAVPAILVLSGSIDLSVGGALPWKQYLLTQPRVWLTYLRLIVFPVGQNLDYDFAPSGSLFDGDTLGSIAGILMLVYIAYRLFRKNRLASFGIAWFVVTLLPESSILPLPDVIYEHRLYLPMVGVSMACVSLLYTWTRAWARAIVVVVAGLLVVFLGFLTFERNNVWKDELSLWADVVSKSPGKARPYNNRGKAHLERGMYENALYDFNRALVLNPSYGDAYSNRGTVYLYKGDNPRAISDFQRALQFGVSYAANYDRLMYNLGLAYSNQGDEQKAIENYNEAIRANPSESSSYYNRAISYERRGEYEKSISDYGKAIALRPSYAKAFNNRGVVFGKRGKIDSALIDYSRALSLDPGFLPPYVNRARIYLDRSDPARALADLDIALKIEQRSPEIYVMRGKVLLKMSAFERALSDFDAALRLDSWRGEVYHLRGIALESTGKRQEANQNFQRARALGFKASD